MPEWHSGNLEGFSNELPNRVLKQELRSFQRTYCETFEEHFSHRRGSQGGIIINLPHLSNQLT